MPISLAEGKNNAQTDLDVAVIDEFRKTGVIPDSLIFDDAVNPAGGGATLTYGYRRLITQATAATRAINSEYTPQNVTTQHYTTDLAVLGGAFEIDRVVAKLGPNASGGVALNIAQKVKSTNAKFADLVINGDTATDANGFDGLDKALTGSSTEMNASVVTDWTDFDTNARAEHVALDLIDEFLSLLDGAPTVIVGNARALGSAPPPAAPACTRRTPSRASSAPTGARSSVRCTAASCSPTLARRPGRTTRSSRSKLAPSGSRPPASPTCTPTASRSTASTVSPPSAARSRRRGCPTSPPLVP